MLESLRLHRISIHHIWQVDFLCRQKTLRHLTLDGAHILYCYLHNRILVDNRFEEGPATFFWRPWGWVFSRIGSELPALAEFEYILSPNNTLGDEEFGDDGWTNRYYTLNVCESGSICWNESIEGDGVGRVPREHPACPRLEKMDLAELVRLKEKLGDRWRFDSEEGVGRELLEDPKAEMVEVYTTGEKSWGGYVWFDNEEDDEENISWKVRKNLELNGLLGRTVPASLVREWRGLD